MAETVCKRCLLNELSDASLYEKVKRTIEAIDEDDKTPASLYEDRLAHCRACEKLVNGMCRLCGCFVEVRAARTIQYCPDRVPHW